MKRQYKIQGNNKKCLDCREFRPMKEYQKRKYGLSSYCNKCMTIRVVKYHQKTHKKYMKYQREWRENLRQTK